MSVNNGLQERGEIMLKNVLFTDLAKLMASIGMTKQQLAKEIGISPASVSKKMAGSIDWKRPEMVSVTSYFKKIDPSITMDKIFYPEVNNSLQKGA